jgi:hypothetical protein
VRPDRGHTDPVDANVTHEWEADRTHRVGTGLLFWCWYLPNEIVTWRGITRPALRRGRALLRYPLVTTPSRRVVARSPIHTREQGG